MSIPRFLLPFLATSPTSLSVSSLQSSTAAARHVSCAVRRPPSSPLRCSSSKRQLQTITAHRPQTLDPETPPRNAGEFDPLVGRVLPQVNETRPPDVTGQDQEINASRQSGPSSEVSKPRRKLRARKAAMTLTPAATTQLKVMLSQPTPQLLRVGIKSAGCSGSAYKFEWVDKPDKFDEVVEQDGIKVLIDSKALLSIIGSEMDWVEEDVKEGYVFRNPNIKESCGCGESFKV